MVNVRVSETGKVMVDESGYAREHVWDRGSTVVRSGTGRVREMRMVSGILAL